jgi:anthranilate phosphoribosyltransferase
VCGSSNLLAHFGYKFTNDADQLRRSIEETGICFLHAPLFHPAMKNVAPIRKELGVKTFFNMLGPMVNPSFPDRQLVGVFSLELARLYAYLYQQTNKRFVILHALDGYDEISLTGGFKMLTNQTEQILHPHELGLRTVRAEELYGGETVEEAARIFTDILEGKGTEAQNSVVVANAGVALHCGKGLPLEDAMAEARESLVSGKAKTVFQKLISQ